MAVARPSMYGRVGINLGPMNYFDAHLVTPDLIWSGYPFLFGLRQTTTGADHVSGQGWVPASSSFVRDGSRVGSIRSFSVRVRDAATSTTVAGTLYGVVGSNVWFPSGALTNDRAVLAGNVMDNSEAGVFNSNSSMLAIGSAYLDNGRDTGYTAIASGQTFLGQHATAKRLPAGVYTPLARGTGVVRIQFGYTDGTTSSNTSVTVTNGVCSPATVTAALPVGTIYVTHATGNASTPVYDFVLVVPDRPGMSDRFAASYLANLADTNYFLFHPDYLDSLKNFKVLRLMDWHSTNNSVAKNWSDRTPPGRLPGRAMLLGPSYEVSIRLCNELKADPWVCVPHEATDDFVTQLATLFRDNLDPARKVYFEYTNETWNSIFHQYNYCVTMGLLANSPYSLSSLTYSAGTGKCTATLANTTCAALGLANSDTVVVENATDGAYNGAFTISGVSGSSFDYTPGSAPSLAAASPQALTALMAYETSDSAAKTVSSIAWSIGTSSATATLTTSTSHGYSSGDFVLVSGCSDPGFNGVHVLSSASGTTMTFRYDTHGGTRVLPAVVASSTTVNASAASGQTMRVLRLGANSATGNVKNLFEMNRRWYGRRTGEVQALFQAVFAGQYQRLAPVLAFQAAGLAAGNDSYVTNAYLAALGGSRPAGPDYCWAIAPYFGAVGLSDTGFVGATKTPTAFSYSAGTVTVTCNSHGYSTGDAVQIANVGPAGNGGNAYNGVWTITVTDANTFTYTPVGTPTTTSGLTATNTSFGMLAVKNPPYMRELISATRSGTTVTCVSYNHGLSGGEQVRLSNFSQYDYQVSAWVAVVDAHTFTFETSSTLTPTASAGRLWVLKYAGVEKVLDDTEVYFNATLATWLNYHRGQAQANGSRLVAYECGPHNLTTQNTPALIDAYVESNHAPRMGRMCERYYDLMGQLGVDLACWFNHVQSAGKSGTWGLLDFQAQDRTITPKFTAAARR